MSLWSGKKAMSSNPDTIYCPACGYYCLGKGGFGCIDKPILVEASTDGSNAADFKPIRPFNKERFIKAAKELQAVQASPPNQATNERTKLWWKIVHIMDDRKLPTVGATADKLLKLYEDQAHIRRVTLEAQREEVDIMPHDNTCAIWNRQDFCNCHKAKRIEAINKELQEIEGEQHE